MSKRQDIKNWVRQARHADTVEQDQQEKRDTFKGCFDTGGRRGIAPKQSIDEAMRFAAGETDLDDRDLDGEDDEFLE